jgi:hypothetical protein
MRAGKCLTEGDNRALFFVMPQRVSDAVLLYSGSFYISLESLGPAADAAYIWY